MLSSCVDTHSGGFLGITTFTGNTAAPDDETNDDEDESETPDEDVGPSTEDFLFVAVKCND